MITYGFSVQGKSHIKRGTVCQDYSKAVELGGGWYLGVVADGVGSAPRADAGSKMATEALCDFCIQNIDSQMSDGQLENMMRRGYEHAWGEIIRYAQKENAVIDHFDTTLSAALYNGEKVIYGHAGDGGILVRQYDGQIRPITKRQKGADGSSVIPLRGGELSWEFGVCEEKAAAVLLATDGMLDGVFQPVLVNLPPDRDSLVRGNFPNDNAYITASEFFMSPDSVYQNKRIKDPDAIMRKFMAGGLKEEDQEVFLKCILESYIKLLGKENAIQIGRRVSKYYYAVWALKEVTDDKSVVCLINEKKKVAPQDITYYYEPDWKHRKECYNALLYGRPMPQEQEKDMSEGNYPSKEKDFGTSLTKKTGKRPDKGGQIRARRIRAVAVTSVLAVLFLGGIIVVGTKMLSGGNDDEHLAEKAQPTPTATRFTDISDEPDEDAKESERSDTEDEQELTKRGKQKIKKVARTFARVLEDSEYLESHEDQFGDLLAELEAHGLDKELKNFLAGTADSSNDLYRSGRGKTRPAGTKIPSPTPFIKGKTTISPKPGGTPSPTPVETGDEKNEEDGNKINFEDLIDDISGVDNEDKIVIFMETFETGYNSLEPDGKKNLSENLRNLLNYDD